MSSVDLSYDTDEYHSLFDKFYKLYNNPDGKDWCIKYLDDKLDVLISDSKMFMDFLFGPEWTSQYVINNIDRFLKNPIYYSNVIYPLVKWGIRTDRLEFLKILAYHDNLSVRAEFMETIFSEHRSLIDYFYPADVCSYFVKKDENGNVTQKMDEFAVSKIAVALFDFNFREKLFNEIKEFIFSNYEFNHMACLIDDRAGDDELSDFDHRYSTLLGDINRFFKTSINYKYELYKSYGHIIDDALTCEYLKVLDMIMKCEGCKEWDIVMISAIITCNLRDTFVEMVTKYMKLTGTENICFVGSGSTSFCIRIGEYVLKFSYGKHESFYKVPELFLIIKNHEYYEYRNILGKIEETIEVQNYLKRPLKNDELHMERLFREELMKLGYVVEDDLLREKNPNCYYLDDYHDANSDDPEGLPDWFKESPLVLVDRDLIVPVEKTPFKKVIVRDVKID